MSTKPSTGRVRSVYEFIKAHRDRYSVQTMCRVLGVAPSGYYEWLQQPISNRAQEDARLLRLIRASFVASHGVYGAPRVFLDLREAGENMQQASRHALDAGAKLRALHGYRTRRWAVGKPAVLIPNLLERQFTATKRNTAWVTDITYIRTWQGWLYLAVVMDLFSRMIVGWAAGPIIHRELVLNAVLMAVRRRRPRGTLIHSDQGTQYGSDAWRRFCRSNHLEPSMSRKGNCWDNAVAESFFGSLKKERIKKQIYKTGSWRSPTWRPTSIPSTIEPAATVTSVGLVPSNSKPLTTRVDGVSTKSWELQWLIYAEGEEIQTACSASRCGSRACELQGVGPGAGPSRRQVDGDGGRRPVKGPGALQCAAPADRRRVPSHVDAHAARTGTRWTGEADGLSNRPGKSGVRAY